MSTIICTQACATIRVAVYTVSIFGEELQKMQSASSAGIKQYRKIQEKYTEILMNLLTKTGTFETVRLKHDYEEYLDNPKSYAKSHQKPNEEEYRPYYRRSMTGNTTTADDSIFAYKAIYITKAIQEGCRYSLDAFVTFDTSLRGKVSVTANVNLFDTEDSDNLAIKHFSSMVSVPVSSRNVSQTKTKGKTPSKKAKDFDPESQTIVQAVDDVFAKLVAYIRDETTGEPAKVINIQGTNITVNKGASSQVSKGDIYLVQAEVDDEMDDVFASEEATSKLMNIAVIRIVDVQDNSSTAEIVENGGYIDAIRIGDELKPQLPNYIEALSSNQNTQFPSKRPEKKRIAQTPKSPSQVTSAATEPLPPLPPGTVRIGIMNFDSKARQVSEKDASVLTDLLSRLLSNSDKIAVLERNRLKAIVGEQNLRLSGFTDPSTAAQIGKLASCQYILMGSVTGFQERDTISGRYIRPTQRADYSSLLKPNTSRTGAGILLGLQILSDIVDATNAQKNNVVTETHEVITDIDIRLVEVQTGRILAAFTEQGSAAQSDIVTQDGNGQLKGVEANYGSLNSRAIASTAANLNHKIREALTGEKVLISSVNDDEIIINKGSDSGIQVGDLFCVYTEGQSYGDTEAIISVTDVQDSFSTAKLETSTTASYSFIPGSRLEPVLYSDFQKGIWHIKNLKRSQAVVASKQDISLEDLANNLGRKKKLETSSTDAKKVIKSYRLTPTKEKALIAAHSKASKASNAQKKYESYKQLSEADINDYLAAYNAGKYALELSMYMEAREWASKALFVNPNYKPAQALIEKIDNGD